MYDVLIIGAGPAGLAAAIAAKSRGMRYVVIEKGALVNSLLHYPTDMKFFTTPELLEIGGMPFVSPNDKPTRQEALRYYRRVVDTFALDVRLGERVTAVVPRPDGTFVVTSRPEHAVEVTQGARAIVVASGAYDMPNPLNVPGENLPHVSHFYHEPHPYYRKRVLIVGGKNSAADAALEIYRAGGAVVLVHRGAQLSDSIKYWVRPDIENRIKEGSIKARFNTHIVEITPGSVVVDGPDGRVVEPVDFVLLLTGYRSDLALLRMAGTAIDERIGAPLFDAETLETNVSNLFVIGACVAGQQSGHIFIENGRFHGEVAVREIQKRLTPQEAV
ncbi:MAG: YpdA family putative bacillithiol disulfide reductase [Vicinamibacterales bacterium]